MVVPTFVDLQGFLVGRQFVVKEFAALRKRTVLSHYIFASLIPWHFLASADKSRARWAVHGTEEDDDDDDDDDSDAVVYVKGHEKRQWLWNLLLDDERVYIETLDADYEDVDSLNNLDADNTMRCGYHYTNCALQNMKPPTSQESVKAVDGVIPEEYPETYQPLLLGTCVKAINSASVIYKDDAPFRRICEDCFHAEVQDFNRVRVAITNWHTLCKVVPENYELKRKCFICHKLLMEYNITSDCRECIKEFIINNEKYYWLDEIDILQDEEN
ncbi:hypothetical protein P5V15_010363 [Pogonomyrmex californicus]